jgi:cobalt-zinc-cadmium efflux system protein
MHHHASRQHKITVAVLLNIFFTIIESVGGVLTNNRAILSDALHNLGDSIVLIISVTAEKNALKPADARKTYG